MKTVFLEGFVASMSGLTFMWISMSMTKIASDYLAYLLVGSFGLLGASLFFFGILDIYEGYKIEKIVQKFQEK